MKVIDLLNKIANGEEVPEQIYYGKQYWINKYPNDYEGLGYGGCLLNNVCLNNLNDEVEIIEDKKIQKLREPLFQDDTLEYVKLIQSKINEIIEYMNKGEIDEKNK